MLGARTEMWVRARAVNRLLTLVCLALTCATFTGTSTAQQFAQPATCMYPQQAMVCPSDLLRACCDDYCRKPCPCVPGFCSARSCDDYCRKPGPVIPCFSGCTDCGCYCRKPWPDLCRPLAADYRTCCGSCTNCVARPTSAVRHDHANGEYSQLLRDESSFLNSAAR